MTATRSRPPARRAAPELIVLARWEELTGWLLQHTGRWPKSTRFTLCRRVQDHTLDVAEWLVAARFDKQERPETLARVNLTLERMRLLLRLAHSSQVMPPKSFERAMRCLDEVGRMVHGWRSRGPRR